jgi:hypothetical protein
MAIGLTIAPTGASADKLNVGQSLTFTATPSGGGTPVYQWKRKRGSGEYANVGTNSDTFAYVPVVADIGTVTIMCSRTDDIGADSNEVASTITAAEVQTITTPAVAQTIVLGESIAFVGSTSGGSTIASRDWTEDDVSLAHDAATLTYTPTTIGAHTIKFKATDASDADDKTTDDLSAGLVITVVSINTAIASAAGYLAKIAAAV